MRHCRRLLSHQLIGSLIANFDSAALVDCTMNVTFTCNSSWYVVNNNGSGSMKFGMMKMQLCVVRHQSSRDTFKLSTGNVKRQQQITIAMVSNAAVLCITCQFIETHLAGSQCCSSLDAPLELGKVQLLPRQFILGSSDVKCIALAANFIQIETINAVTECLQSEELQTYVSTPYKKGESVSCACRLRHQTPTRHDYHRVG